MSTASPALVDVAQFYGPNDHTFVESTDADGQVRRDKDGRVVAVYATPGLGPEADVVLLEKHPKAARAQVDAERRQIEQERAELAAERAALAREIASLPASVRAKLAAPDAA